MLHIQYDAVLVVIDIGRILQAPAVSVQLQRDDAQILAGGMIQSSGIAHIFRTELAAGIAALFCVAGGGDGTGILLRLGEIDGDLQLAERSIRQPFFIPGHAGGTDIVGILAQGVEIIRRHLGGQLIPQAELLVHLAGAGRQCAHQPGVEQILLCDGISADTVFHRIGHQRLQQLIQ